MRQEKKVLKLKTPKNKRNWGELRPKKAKMNVAKQSVTEEVEINVTKNIKVNTLPA